MEKLDRQLFQYKNASRFNVLLIALYDQAVLTSPINLILFLDIDSAVGNWLTQLADIFNVPRSYTNVGIAFILDISQLDATNLDGGGSPVNDTVLRALLKAKIHRNVAPVKSINYINDVLSDVLNPVAIEVEDGTKELIINLTFVTGAENYYTWLAITSIDTKWFGCPAGTGVTYNITLV